MACLINEKHFVALPTTRTQWWIVLRHGTHTHTSYRAVCHGEIYCFMEIIQFPQGFAGYVSFQMKENQKKSDVLRGSNFVLSIGSDLKMRIFQYSHITPFTNQFKALGTPQIQKTLVQNSIPSQDQTFHLPVEWCPLKNTAGTAPPILINEWFSHL